MTEHVHAEFCPNPPCKIAFVGEAPGAEELFQGRPFVGPSGKIFNAALRTANIDRASVLVTNVFDEQLPGNNLKHGWLAGVQEARAGGYDDLPPVGKDGYLRPEHRPHLERLRDELKRANPNVIVPLGGTALWAFTGSTEISRQRGAIQPANFIVPGAKLLPTFHPAYIRRGQWRFLPVMVEDFQKAVVEAERGPKIFWAQKRLLLAPTLEELRAYVPKLLAADVLTVDIETGWGQITMFGLGPAADEAMCVPFWDFTASNRSYWRTAEEEVQAWLLVKEVLESPVPKLMQFGTYDAYWSLVNMGLRIMNYSEDTRLMSAALYPEMPKDLAFLGGSYTTQGPWKTYNHAKEVKRDG